MLIFSIKKIIIRYHLTKVLSIILLFFSLSISFLACEIFLRLIHFKTNQLFANFNQSQVGDTFQVDSNLIYTIHNNLKFRTPIKPKDSNKTNIAFVGDSVTWSFGSPDDNPYPLSFEKKYNSDKLTSKKIIVNNFGIPGYNFDQEYLLIKEKILPQYHPDIIIWNFNTNDLRESNYSCLFTFKNNQWQKISARFNTYYWYGAIRSYNPNTLKNSRLFSLFWYQITGHIVPSLFSKKFTYGCSKTNYNDQTREEIINKLHFFLDNLIQETNSQNIKLIITLVPFQQYFDYELSPNQISLDYFFLHQFLIKNYSNIFLDYNTLYYQIPKKTNPADYLFLSAANDVGTRGWRHPNPQMYNLMADALKKYVQKNHLF